MTTNPLPPANGTCWCGCRGETTYGRRFVQGHDKLAEAAYMAVHHEGSVAQLLHDTGFGPGGKETIRDAALARGGWEPCPRGCGYTGAPTSIRNHIRKSHQSKEG